MVVIMSNSIQKCLLDIPDEILEDNLFTLLSFRDLLSLMNIGNARLFRCCIAVIKKRHYSYFRSEWFEWNAKKGNLERKDLNMKIIYKIMKEKGFEVDINDWRDGTFYGNYVPYADITILMKATL